MIERPGRQFWHKLALALGMSVRRAQQEIDAREYASWVAYHQIDPFGNERADFHAALIAWTMASTVRGKGPAPQLKDYFPDFAQKPKAKMDAQQLFDMMLMKTIAMGGKVIRPNGN